jgi:hypothetical protein
MTRGAAEPTRALAVGLSAVLALGPARALAQTGVGADVPGTLSVRAAAISSSNPSTTEGALTLLLPVGAKGVGLAMTAMPGPESGFWNPAGLARLEEGRFLVFRSNHLAGEATAFSLLLTHASLGTAGISYQLLDLGDQDLRDKDGNVLGTVSFRDHLAVASFGTTVLSRLDAGLNFKVFQSRVLCRGQCTDAGVTGTTFAVDAGILATPLASLPFRVGAMVAHAGPALQLINVEQADPLPTRVRLAAAYEVLRHLDAPPEVELWLTGEIEDRWRDPGSPILFIGGELLAGREDRLLVRAGFGQGQEGLPSGASVGLGLVYDRFEMGIAKRYGSGGVISGENEPVHVTFGVVF